MSQSSITSTATRVGDKAKQETRMPGLDGNTSAKVRVIEDMEATEAASCSGKEMRDGLMFTEVQRLQRILEESNMAASQTESDLHHRCQVLAAQVDLLTRQLSEREGPNGAAAAAPDTPSPHVPLTMQPSVEALPGSPSGTFFNYAGSNGINPFDEDEDEEEEFWELSILPGDVMALDSSSHVAATDPGAPIEANGDIPAAGHQQEAADISTLDDTAMGDPDEDIGPRLKLVKSPSGNRGSMTPRMETDATAANDKPSTSSCHGAPERRVSDTSAVSSSSSSSGCCDTDKATGYSSTQDLDAYTDISSLGGYTFGAKDMEQLIAESDSLQLLVAHLSAALEQADDDKQHLEDYLRSMIEARTASMMQVHSGMAPPTQWFGLKNLQEGSKDETLYTELLQRLDHSRSALQQSTEAQKQLRKKADKLREAGDVLRSALGATETEMKLHMEKVGVLEAALKAQCVEAPEALQTLNERLQVVEAWRQRAKKAVESCSTAWMPSSHQSYYEHLDRTSKSQTSEILTLREENKNLTAQLADMSIQFAEADSEHLETKRALARSEQRMQELKQELEGAKALLDAKAVVDASTSPEAKSPSESERAAPSEAGSASASGSPGLSNSKLNFTL